AVDGAGQVYPQKRQARVRNRVDEPPHEACPFRPQPVVGTPERHNANGRPQAGQPGHVVAVEPRAVHQQPGPEPAHRGDGLKASCGRAKVCYSRSSYDPHPAAFEHPRHRRRHLAVVDDARLWRKQCCAALRVGFYALEFLAVDQPEPGNAVLGALAVQGLEARHLFLGDGHDHLAAILVADPVSAAKALEPADALHTQARFQGLGTVVNPRMDDATVMARLMAADPRLLLEHDDAEPRAALRQSQRRRESYDAAPND